MCELFSLAKFSLDDGDDLLLLSLFQRYTYESLLLGGPSPRLTAILESRYPEEVSSIFLHLDGPTVVIDSQMITNDANEPVLPNITCFGRFWSSGKIVAEHKQFDCLFVIWFEKVGGAYMSIENLAKLRRRDWRTISVPLAEPNHDDW